MAARKMTFSLPEHLAAELLRRVAARDRSRFVMDAIQEGLKKRDAELIRACDIANQDTDVSAIEGEFDGIADPLAEPWK